jgi:hypothetical protein
VFTWTLPVGLEPLTAMIHCPTRRTTLHGELEWLVATGHANGTILAHVLRGYDKSKLTTLH